MAKEFEIKKVKNWHLCCVWLTAKAARCMLHRVHRECNEYLSDARVGDPPAPAALSRTQTFTLRSTVIV